MYPPKSIAWKNTIAVFQTFEAPPNKGRINFVNIGCTENKSVAERKIVAVKMTANPIERRSGVPDVVSEYSASLKVMFIPRNTCEGFH